MKQLRLIILCLLINFIIIVGVNAAYVNNPVNCPAEHLSQTCRTPTPHVCGVSGITECWDNSTITPRSTDSTVESGTYNTNGGYHIDCTASADSAAPYCDNNGSQWCLQKTSCYNAQRKTICTGGQWAVSTCGTCKTGYNDCNSPSPDGDCIDYSIGERNNDPCTTAGGAPGFWNNCVCVGSTLKLGPDSVSGTNTIIQSISPLMYISNTGASIGTSTIPQATALNVVGASIFSSPLVVGTPTQSDHAATKDYVDSSIASSTGAMSFWTQSSDGKLYPASSTVNVGIGDTNPGNKLSVNGNISGSGALSITGTATSSNYFISNLGIGSLPSGYWNKFVDLSGNGNSAYIVKTGSINAVVAASDNGTPAETGYDFTYSDKQMVLGSITKHPLNFIVNGGSKMFLSFDGKLGIGTISPTEMLDVNGGTRIGTINNATGDIVTVSSSGVIQKRTAAEIRGDIGAAKEINSLYYVEGNTVGTAGAWTGNIDGLAAYYDGLTIAYKIGIAGASVTNLDINQLGNRQVYRNTGALTTHLAVGTVVVLTYTTVSGTGRWVWADYDVDSGYYYLRWNGPSVIAGVTINRYKIIMEGHDGRFYPLTFENLVTANSKTISSAKFKMNGQILWYNTTTVIDENGLLTSTNLYSDLYATEAEYTFNQISGWTAGKAVYLVGTIDNDGYFVLDGAGSQTSTFLSQNLPTTDDGKVYISLGYMTNTTDGFKLTPDRVAYHYKDGKIRLYETMSGVGSANYITRWIGNTSLGSSLIYDTGNDIGINTTNPSSTLHVNGYITVDPPLFANHAATKDYVDSSIASSTGAMNFWTQSSDGKLYPASSTVNVGIGDTNPGNKLSVNGNISGSEALSITGNGKIMGNLGIGNDPAFSTITFSRYADLTGLNHAAYLSRTASVTAAIIAAENGIPAGANLGYSDQQIAFGSLSSHPINFITNGTSKMFLTNDGKLGIGTTTPDSMLNLYSANNTEGLRIVSSNYSPLVIMSSSSVNLFKVDQDGKAHSSAYCDIDGNNCFNPNGGWGTVSYFATVTTATYDGKNNGTVGYVQAHGLCNTKLTGTHVCSVQEILNTIKLNRTMPQEDVWIFGGAPGYTAAVNDCEARSSNASSGKFGTYWQQPDSSAGYPLGRGLITNCNSLLKLACCY